MKIKLWIRNRYTKVINSIAFFPAFFALLFLIVSSVVIYYDFSDQGKQFKASINWLSLKDATTARSIISAIAAGIISLTVFSFSMVMIVLNQAASQLSNRILDKLIGNRFQQFVLGIYIGTIVFALFLLSTIRDRDSGVYIPALSVYLLILITIVDIFIFIYFLHYITQSVKYEVIIERIFKETRAAMKHHCHLEEADSGSVELTTTHKISSTRAGVYESFDKKGLLQICDKHDCVISLLLTPGSFILKGLPIAVLNKQLPEEACKNLMSALHVNTVESIEENCFYGCRQLTEIAMKALSPGINDPGTAILSLRALFQLLAYRANHFPATAIKNKAGKTIIQSNEIAFEQVFADSIFPVWNYGRQDRMIQHELYRLLEQLYATVPMAIVGKLLQEVKTHITD